VQILRVVAVVVLGGAQVWAQASGDMRKAEDLRQMNTRPSVLEKVGIDQRLGEKLPLEAKFRDELGREVKLGDYFHKRPVVLALVYYDCPMLCTQVLNGLTGALMGTKFTAGKEFDVLAVSFDPRETPRLAGEKKQVYLDRYKRQGADQGFHFLTGTQESITALTQAAGFHYVWDEKTSQFAHGSAIMIVTPEGRMHRYFYGIEYAPKEIQFGVMEASQEKIGSVVDQMILYCYHYDPTTGKYGLVAMTLIRVGGVLTVLLLGTFMAVSFRRDARNRGKYPELEDSST
jgi:protein SCO1/2